MPSMMKRVLRGLITSCAPRSTSTDYPTSDESGPLEKAWTIILKADGGYELKAPPSLFTASTSTTATHSSALTQQPGMERLISAIKDRVTDATRGALDQGEDALIKRITESIQASYSESDGRSASGASSHPTTKGVSSCPQLDIKVEYENANPLLAVHDPF